MPDASRLLGTWTMISWQREVIATGERLDALGPNPVGFINYGADGRMFAIVVQKERAAPAGAVPSDEEKVRLFNSMLAYAGTYSLDDEKVVHHIDASWNQAWTGTNQVRFYTINGDVLTITGAPAKDPYTGQEVLHRIVFRKLAATQ
jgi:hypothetical protein